MSKQLSKFSVTILFQEDKWTIIPISHILISLGYMPHFEKNKTKQNKTDQLLEKLPGL